MSIIINNILNLENTMQKNKNKLITNIVVDENKINQWIENRIVTDQLKFKYKYEYFGINEGLTLMKYITNQSSNWKFNEKSLNEIFKMFKRRYSKEIIKRKVFKMGIDFCFD